ncbi:hypothetical protein [Pantoea sp.]|uniref:hypothetical protein n=1 Tax=Pantoea sp. TaxID=69393 RepID=UPI0028A8DDE3|nr:hypothetical protein [Pantoea sp.]
MTVNSHHICVTQLILMQYSFSASGGKNEMAFFTDLAEGIGIMFCAARDYFFVKYIRFINAMALLMLIDIVK